MKRAILWPVIGLLATFVVFATNLLGVPNDFTVQGVLRDGGGNLVADGPYTITFSIWDDSTSGSMLWSESQSVQVKSGVFSVTVGRSHPMTTDTQAKYLQYQILGSVPISPRTELTSTPYSLVTNRMSGDVSTSPKHLAIGDVSGDGHMDFYTNEDSSVARVISLNGLPPGTPVIGTLRLTTTNTAAGIAIGDPGVNGRGIELSVSNSSAPSIAIGDPGVNGRGIVMSADSSGAGSIAIGDPGVNGRLITMNVGGSAGTSIAIGDPGVNGNRVSLAARPDSTNMSLVRLNGLPPGTPVIGTLQMTTTNSAAGIAIGDPGVNGNRISMNSDSSGGTGASLRLTAKGKHTVETHCSDGSGIIVMTNSGGGTTDTGIVIDGAQKRFGIGVSQPSNPVELASGAKCTPGGVWTNACDRNLKENFRTVDGEELLEKIEQLPVTEWNYKNEGSGVNHIGPTAQDFRQAFGLGGDDKTISTIDPSGIALAAIKELARENGDLKKQNEKLQKRVEYLEKAIDKMAREKR